MNLTAGRILKTYVTLTLFSTFSSSFIWGINTLFLLDAGLSITEAFTANAFFTVGQVLFEVPTGVVADTLGRRVSYLLGSATLFASTILYLLMWQISGPFWAWAVISMLLGLGFTFFSGATEAWLVDGLNFAHYQGTLEAATKPDTFRVQRAINIKAPPEKIFPLINDFHSFAAWSPYEKKDFAMKRTLSGAANGKGAVYEWEGDHNVGKGRMEITDTAPPNRVTIKLDFIKPFETHNIVEFTLDANGDSTNVTWAMHGPSPYIAKVMHVFFDMDSMVGKDFETGLANLKTIAEK